MTGEILRNEYKYFIDARQDGILSVLASGLLMRDSHTNENGRYIIRSLYLDDIHDTCLADNLRGADPRSKFRIRYYGSDLKYIMLEKKSKCRGKGQKKSCRLTEDECLQFMEGKIPPVAGDMPDKKKELFTEAMLSGLIPKVIVTYEREPFIYPGGNVRVTFDRSLTSSDEIGNFLSGQYIERPVFPCGQSLLEVKWDEVLPMHIKETLSIENLKWTAFSKYSMCRTYRLR